MKSLISTRSKNRTFTCTRYLYYGELLDVIWKLQNNPVEQYFLISENKKKKKSNVKFTSSIASHFHVVLYFGVEVVYPQVLYGYKGNVLMNKIR